MVLVQRRLQQQDEEEVEEEEEESSGFRKAATCGFWVCGLLYNGSVSLSAYLGHVSHSWSCETTDMLRTKKREP